MDMKKIDETIDSPQRIQTRKQIGIIQEDVIKRKRQYEDYDLGSNANNQIAKYEPQLVMDALNERDYILGFRHLFLKGTKKGLQNTLVYNTSVILMIYFIFWLIFYVFYEHFTTSCVEPTHYKNMAPTVPNQQSGNTKSFGCAVFNSLDDNVNKYIESAKNTEKNLLKLMTFLLGFYVKRMMARWWDQVSKIPTMESICLAMNGMGTSIDEKGGDDGLNKFKQRIARYLLLSWTMCLSGMSLSLNIKYDKDALINKGLITRKEWEALTNMGGSKDGWKDKWWIPLSWATKLINVDEKVGKKQFADHKYIMTEISKFGEKLQHICLYSENPMPRIQRQAITTAAWALLIVGVLAGQERNLVDDGIPDAGHIVIKFFLNMPLINFIIYILIFAWIKVAEKLSNPFGSDYQVDVNTVSRLDYEIWMASHLIQKNSMLPDQNIRLAV